MCSPKTLSHTGVVCVVYLRGVKVVGDIIWMRFGLKGTPTVEECQRSRHVQCALKATTAQPPISIHAAVPSQCLCVVVKYSCPWRKPVNSDLIRYQPRLVFTHTQVAPRSKLAGLPKKFPVDLLCFEKDVPTKPLTILDAERGANVIAYAYLV